MKTLTFQLCIALVLLLGGTEASAQDATKVKKYADSICSSFKLEESKLDTDVLKLAKKHANDKKAFQTAIDGAGKQMEGMDFFMGITMTFLSSTNEELLNSMAKSAKNKYPSMDNEAANQTYIGDISVEMEKIKGCEDKALFIRLAMQK